jgi:glutathione-regulated potassium-efflux system ancillary protein KefG
VRQADTAWGKCGASARRGVRGRHDGAQALGICRGGGRASSAGIPGRVIYDARMAPPRRILVLLAHPVLERSRVNRRLAKAIEGVPGVTLHDLYETYPTLDIDVRREQALLLEHDVVVFQHPFYWYSVPSLLKEWQDLVLEHGWAYGKDGTHLRGKLTMNAVSTGGPQQVYRHEGRNRFTMREFLAPWDQTAWLCGMTFLAPFVVHGSFRLNSEADVAPHAAAYRRLLEALRDGELDVDKAAQAERINEDLDALVGGAASAAGATRPEARA